MPKTVLFVDDDRILCNLVKKKFIKFADSFAVVTAADGREAVGVLRDQHISLVVTDLKMPEMDGFALLAHMSEKYPDIPAIVLTAYGSQDSRQLAMEGGAIGFLKKPVVLETLGRGILGLLRRESEGGTIQTVSLEVFVKLVVQEKKTGTIRVSHKPTGKHGVLFFKDGVLMDARFDDVRGKAAADEILAWDRVNLDIQNACVVDQRTIAEDPLQMLSAIKASAGPLQTQGA